MIKDFLQGLVKREVRHTSHNLSLVTTFKEVVEIVVAFNLDLKNLSIEVGLRMQ